MKTQVNSEGGYKKRDQRWLFLLFSLVAVIGFFAGTRQDDITRLLDPIRGIERSNETIDLSSVQATYQYLIANYAGDVDTQTLIDGANKGLVAAAGDKYTTYFTAKEAEDFKKELSGDVGAGIGAVIGVRNDQPAIIRVLDDNPAKDAGLRAGDVITAVNGEPAIGWKADEAASKIRGDEGTTVKLTILRDGKEQAFVIKRSQINNPSVTSELDGAIGTMTISRFDGQTGALARKAALSLKEKGASSIIIDLRSDGGGYLSAAVDVAGLWLEDKTVVTQKSKDKIIDTQKTGNDAPLKGMKTLVLVNGGTASASEILASALRDYDVAKLVGEKTFGKGSVQQVIDLSDAALLKVTVAKWYTPKDKNINQNGLVPDYEVNLTDKDSNNGRDPQLDKAKQLLKS